MRGAITGGWLRMSCGGKGGGKGGGGGGGMNQNQP